MLLTKCSLQHSKKGPVGAPYTLCHTSRWKVAGQGPEMVITHTCTSTASLSVLGMDRKGCI